MISAFETTDLDEAHEMLCRTYTRLRINAVGRWRRMRITQMDVGPVGLHHTTFEMCHRAVVPPMGVIPIGRELAGTTRFQTGRDVTESGPGDLFLCAQPDRELHAESDNHDGEYARFPPDIFAQIADAAPGRAPRPIRFTGYRPVSAQAAATWNSTYDYVRDNIAGVSAADEPLLAGTAARMLAAVTLATFPNTALHDPTIEDRHDARPATLRRAVAFIDENAHRDITPADIAAAARVTVRSLQLAFRRHLGTTPTAHLRRVRLEQAHDQLLAADPGATTVSTVAMRWGFASHSSFTAHYRAAYGILPSATLRRR